LSLNGTSNGGVYIGGSSFMKNMVASGSYPEQEIPYMTGISALKAGSRLKYAFMEYNALNNETRLYKSDNSYLLLPAFLTKDFIDITDKNNIFINKMLNGADNIFNLQDRAAHFKGLWENLWKNHDLYKRYVDTTAINILKEHNAANLQTLDINNGFTTVAYTRQYNPIFNSGRLVDLNIAVCAYSNKNFIIIGTPEIFVTY
jgi:hypothetical protein